jgi:ketosteroid isomerase-like protein
VSRENVDVVRALFAAVAERDLDVLRALTHPDVVWQSFFAALLRGGEYRGHDELARYVSDLDEAFEVLRPEAMQMIEVGDVVVGLGRVAYRGRASGVETDELAGWVFRLKDGRVLSFHAFREPEQVFARLGPDAR